MRAGAAPFDDSRRRSFMDVGGAVGEMDDASVGEEESAAS